ncbi:hypothetical protein [Altererythrobacter lauratis]|uniref:Uncharacterized protein n=1 Tax=Alteraurantiacibacter lauratis TaxID=2054627 RepID=A0ABV7EJQ8_9SPHN
MRYPAVLLPFLLLAACERGEPAQRVELAPSRDVPVQVMRQSPDTTGAVWRVAESGRAIEFAKAGDPPLLTLACLLGDTAPPQMLIVRHAPALPRQSALFPVIGNGMRSRFFVDARLTDGEWRWEGVLAASDPMWDVFTGPRELQATLPGGGMLKIPGSRVPGEFVTWCRAGGQAEPASEPPEAPLS